MSKDKIDPLDVVEFCLRVDQGIAEGVDPEAMMDIMTVQHIISKSRGRGFATITDGKRTIQCVINNAATEHPKKKKA